ncbi:MAG: hypothetical protein Q7S92_06640 [Candidatus Diapherotrites archaeon]|nr:hypothetical protein [Candidatus Diapherotrites archaeon]
MADLSKIRKITGIIRDSLFIVSIIFLVLMILTTITAVNQLGPIVQKATGVASGLAGAVPGVSGGTVSGAGGTGGSSVEAKVAVIQEKLTQVNPEVKTILENAFVAYQAGNLDTALTELDKIKPIAVAQGKPDSVQTVDQLKTALQNNDLISVDTLTNRLLDDLALE